MPDPTNHPLWPKFVAHLKNVNSVFYPLTFYNPAVAKTWQDFLAGAGAGAEYEAEVRTAQRQMVTNPSPVVDIPPRPPEHR